MLPASTTPYTILSGTMSGTGAGGDEQAFILGTSSIWLKGDVAQQIFMHLVYTNTRLAVKKVGSATTTFGVTYVPRNRNTTPDPELASSTVSVTVGSSTMTTTDYASVTMNTVIAFALAFAFGYWLVKKFI